MNPQGNRPPDPKDIRWTYGIVHPDGGIDDEITLGVPMADERIRQIVGGDFELVEMRDGNTIAFRKDQEGLPENFAFPGVRGEVVLGKISDGSFGHKGKFMGVLGVAWKP